MTADERITFIVLLGEMRGGKWSWQEMRWAKVPQLGGF
jgi:hypothetical protein